MIRHNNTKQQTLQISQNVIFCFRNSGNSNSDSNSVLAVPIQPETVYLSISNCLPDSPKVQHPLTGLGQVMWMEFEVGVKQIELANG